MKGVRTAGFGGVLEFIEERTGIHLPETNYRLVKAYLDEKTSGNSEDLAGYLERLEADPQEMDRFIDAVTINETYFFREERHFDALTAEVLPVLLKRSDRPLRFWSAAASTGEEAFSLAALAAGFLKRGEYRVFASDINTLALDMIREGVYGRNSFRDDGRRYHGLLRKFSNDQGPVTRISQELLASVSAVPVNLSSEHYSGLPDCVHLVFLRNMLIYARLETRYTIISRIVRIMAEGGYLFLSSSEIPLLGHPDLVLENSSGCYYFRKKTAEEKKAGVMPEEPAVPEPHSASAESPTAGQFARSGKAAAADILRHAELRLNNRLYEAAGDPAYAAALDYLEAVRSLNQGELSRTEHGLSGLAELWGENEITDYLHGMLALRRGGEQAAARQWFGTAVGRAPGFWPAVFQAAMLDRSADPVKAGREFSSALRLIESYIKRNSFCYQMLLEGFNARYFAEICRGWIERLSEKGAADGA